MQPTITKPAADYRGHTATKYVADDPLELFRILSGAATAVVMRCESDPPAVGDYLHVAEPWRVWYWDVERGTYRIEYKFDGPRRSQFPGWDRETFLGRQTITEAINGARAINLDKKDWDRFFRLMSESRPYWDEDEEPPTSYRSGEEMTLEQCRKKRKIEKVERFVELTQGMAARLGASSEHPAAGDRALIPAAAAELNRLGIVPFDLSESLFYVEFAGAR